jgi:HAD superfamily hydrolase (TIGR01544 family)
MKYKKALVLDVDGTLNYVEPVPGLKVPSLISILRNQNILNDVYAAEAKELEKKYKPFENDPTISDELKFEKMHAWWSDHFKLKILHGLTLENVRTAIRSDSLIIRNGFKELMEYCKENNILVIFCSNAGLGADSISLLLERENIEIGGNVNMVSNQLKWSDDGVMIGFAEPIMHSGNKNEDFITAANIEIPDKVVLTGNSLGDAKMINNKEGRTVRRIVFCQDESRRSDFEKVFDLVLPETAGFESTLEELKKI